MEAARNLIPSPSPCSQRPRSKLQVSSSALVLHEQVNSSFTAMPTASSTRYFPASVFIQEQREECKPLLHLLKEDKLCQGMLDKGLVGTTSSASKDKFHLNQDMNDFRMQMLKWPGLCDSLPSFETKQKPLQSSSLPSNPRELTGQVELESVVQLARKALSASKEAASLVNECKLIDADLREYLHPSILLDVSVEKEKMVRSTRLHERRSKNRRMPIAVEETALLEKQNTPSKRSEMADQRDPLRLFLSCGETKLLTLKEERETIEQIQALMKLQEIRNRLQDQFAREPTFAEWASACGLDCRTLKSEVSSGQNSREKLIYANFRMVVHVAKQYQGRGLSLEDLLQEGSKGLMKSVEKFKPQAGCRFATYAYWWIRQGIRKAIFHHSRTVRLPDNVYGLLSKVREARRKCVEGGVHQPTKEQVALRAGISVDKLNKLQYTTRMPLSMQQPIWSDQDTTFQEVTSDSSIESPDIGVCKKLMRQHVRSLLNVLSPKERKIIQLRFGIKDGSQKSLSEIGTVFGLSKERVRQLESRALYKLKQHLNSHGLGAYAELLF